MKPEQVQQYVNRYIADRLKEWEESWYGGESPGVEKIGVAYDEDGIPSEDQWQEHLADFSESTVLDAAKALKHNDLKSIEPIAHEFIKRYGLSIKQGSPVLRFVARELLKAEQTIAREIRERAQGTYTNATQSSRHPPLLRLSL